MPKGDKSKEPAFALWKAGRSLSEIQSEIRLAPETKPGSVAGWVLDWERGKQGLWEPRRD